MVHDVIFLGVKKLMARTEKTKTSRVNWEFLSNKRISDAYSRFASGLSTSTEITRELKNTEYASQFRKLVRERGVDRARDAARLALARRSK